MKQLICTLRDIYYSLDKKIKEYMKDYIPEAPSDDNLYGRKNNEWKVIDENKVEEAPKDGNKYLRQDGKWVEETITDISNLATKDELSEKLDKETYYTDKESFVLKEDLPDLNDYVTTETAESTYAKKSELPDTSLLATKEDISDMETKTDASKTYQLIGDYATNSQLEEKVNKEELTDYLTKVDAEDTYAKKGDIPELPIASTNTLGGIKVGAGLSINSDTGVLSATGGGTADSVDWANITSKPETFKPESHQHTTEDITDLQGKLDSKVDNIEISDMLTKTEASSIYQPIGDYATKEELSLKQDKGDYITVQDADEKYQEKGEYATLVQLEDKLDTSTYTQDKTTFALKSEIPDVSNLATKDELSDKVDNSEIVDMLTKTEASNIYQPIGDYALKTDIPEEYSLPIATSEVIGGVKIGSGLSINPETGVLSAIGGGAADSVDWANITSKPETFTPSSHTHDISEVNNLQETLENKANKTDIPDLSGYITESSADSKYQPKGNYATEDSLNSKVDKSEISDMATQSWVESKGYLTEHQDISNLATKEELESKADKSELDNYVTSSNVQSTYATKTELTEGLETKQPVGNYITEESDPTVPSWAKQATKPTYTAGEVGALPNTTIFKTVNNESILGSGNITIDTNNAIDITELVNRLMSQETCSDEDYNKLKEYCINGIVTYAKSDENFGAFNIPLYYYTDFIIIVIPSIMPIYETHTLIIINSEDKSISSVNNTFYSQERYGDGYIGSNYEKQTSYSEITSDDTISKAVGKLEAGLNELQNNSGSINIGYIISKYTDFSGGKFEQSDYNILKECAISGNNIYACDNDSSFTNIVTIMFYNNVLSIYLYDTISSKNEIGIISYTVLYDLSYTINVLSLPYANYIDTIIQNGYLYDYVKSTKYSSITKSDAIKTAIGKLEAGLNELQNSNSSSTSSNNNIYYLSADITTLTSTSTIEKVKEAFGGIDKLAEFITEVAINGKIAVIQYKQEDLTLGNSISIPVSLNITSYGATAVSMSFHLTSINNFNENTTINIALLYVDETKEIAEFKLSTIYDTGYGLSNSLGNLTSSSTSQEISSAIGGKSGMSKLLQVIEDGNRLYIDASSGRHDIMCLASNKNSNGDMEIILGGAALWNNTGSFSLLQITYTKSSDSFNGLILNLN